MFCIVEDNLWYNYMCDSGLSVLSLNNIYKCFITYKLVVVTYKAIRCTLTYVSYRIHEYLSAHTTLVHLTNCCFLHLGWLYCYQ